MGGILVNLHFIHIYIHIYIHISCDDVARNSTQLNSTQLNSTHLLALGNSTVHNSVLDPR